MPRTMSPRSIRLLRRCDRQPTGAAPGCPSFTVWCPVWRTSNPNESREKRRPCGERFPFVSQTPATIVGEPAHPAWRRIPCTSMDCATSTGESRSALQQSQSRRIIMPGTNQGPSGLLKGVAGYFVSLPERLSRAGTVVRI